MSFVDFQKVKDANPFETVIEKLGLDLKQQKNGYRGRCPTCDGGLRALAVTPNKGFYCFDAGLGGDQIALVAHIRGCSVKDGATWLQSSSTIPQKGEGDGEGFKPLSYLEPGHEAVIALGLDEIAEIVGLGFAPRGVMKGTVAIPLRTAEGKLIGYCGVTDAVIPNKWHI